MLEVFSSIQGEGLRLGARQVFVRLGGCNLVCDYCDEPDSIPIHSGKKRALEWVQESTRSLLEERPHDSVSLTGGEPLLHPEFLEQFLPWLKTKGVPAYLETNATVTSVFERLQTGFDAVAADLKLPSAIGKEVWKEHEAFLSVAPEKTFAKIVLTHRSGLEEFEKAVAVVAAVSKRMTLFLQPATPFSGVEPPNPALVLRMYRSAQRSLSDVRIVPQWHPVWSMP